MGPTGFYKRESEAELDEGGTAPGIHNLLRQDRSKSRSSGQLSIILPQLNHQDYLVFHRTVFVCLCDRNDNMSRLVDKEKNRRTKPMQVIGLGLCRFVVPGGLMRSGTNPRIGREPWGYIGLSMPSDTERTT